MEGTVLFSEWLGLIIHILIPSVIVFTIIFGTWQFIIYLKRLFNKLMRKVDGIDDDFQTKI